MGREWGDMFANAARNLEQGRIALIQALAQGVSACARCQAS